VHLPADRNTPASHHRFKQFVRSLPVTDTMNERPKLGGGEGHVNVRLWVLPAAKRTAG